MGIKLSAFINSQNEEPPGAEEMDVEEEEEVEEREEVVDEETRNYDHGEKHSMVNGTSSLVNGDREQQEEDARPKVADDGEQDVEEEEEVVGDQPTVFGLTNKLKQTMSLEGAENVQIDHVGQGDINAVDRDSHTATGSPQSESLVNGEVTRPSSASAERIKSKVAVEPKERHRVMQTRGLFGADGEDYYLGPMTVWMETN